MSLKKLMPHFLVIIFIAGIVYFNKKISPLGQTKNFSTFADANQSVYTNRGVVDRIIQIDLSSQIISENQQEITATILMPFDYDDQLTYSWKLGENVQLVSGELVSHLENLKANQKRQIKISVKGFVHIKNRHVGIEVFGQKNNRRIYGDSLLASQIENTFENTVQNVERLKAIRIGK